MRGFLHNHKVSFITAAVLLTLFTVLSCVGKDKNAPEVVNIPTEKQGPGDVWIEPAELTVQAGASFTNEIHVNSGDQMVAAFGFIVIYDAKLLSVDTEVGNNGTTEGPQGFLSAVNPNNKGELKISGFDVSGKGGPGADLNMVTMHWKAFKAGELTMYVKVDNLVDSQYVTVGKPTGFATKITIE